MLDVNEESEESDAEDEEEDEDLEEDDEMDEDDYQEKRPSAPISKAVSSEHDDDDDEDDDEEGRDQDDAPTGGWGPNKQSYYSTNNLDDLSSDSEMDEEERRELEVREVKRLQSKSRQGMTEEDFGLGQDTLRLEGSVAAREARKRDFEAEAPATAKPSNDAIDFTSLDAVQRAQLISKVQRSTPETLALVGEYADIIEEIGYASKRLKKVMQVDTRKEIVGLCGLHHQILLTYAANLAFYFYLRATPSYASNPQKLASHGIIDRLAKLKSGLQILDSFGFAADDDEERSEDESESIEGDEDEENREPTEFLFRPKMLGDIDEEDDVSLGSLEEDELKQLDREEMESEAAARKNRPVVGKQNGSKPEKKKEKKPKAKKPVAPLASVADIVDEDDMQSITQKRKKGGNKAAASLTTDAEAFSAFGEPTQLAASDSADKEARRRSLKFYTGQIDAKDARRAGGSGLGGDADIPYRDRERSRMAVADANARKAASFNRQADRNLNGDEWGEEDSRDWKDVMDVERTNGKRDAGGGALGDDDDADYYDLVASGKKSAKRAKKDEYDELKAAQRVAPDDSLEEGEHRGISRTIEKNRGLTPRRPKANRNPRVKKRLRFEKAQKKLSSKGPVYKGGQGALQGGYSGEQSGINSNVVKSRQFA